MSANRLLVFLVAGSSVLYAGCGGDNLTLPSEGTPAHIIVVAGDSQSSRVGTQLQNQLIVRVTDSQNRPVNGAPVQFSLDAGTGTGLQPATINTDGDGQASTTITLGSRVGASTGQAQVSAAEGATPVTTDFTVMAVSTDAFGLKMVSGDAQSGPVGTALSSPLVVQVTDQFGNPISHIPVEWSVTGGGSVSETSTQTDDNGLTSVQRTLGGTAGSQTTLATAGGLAGSPVTFTHTALAGNAARVEIVSGNGQSGPPGSVLPQELVVRVLDGDGNPTPARAVSWVIGVGGGSVDPVNSTTDDQGLARTRWTLGPATGNNTVNAVVSGLPTATFNATATKAESHTEITSIDPETSTVGQPVRVEFRVTGSGGTPTGTVRITYNGGSEECTGNLTDGFCNLTMSSPGNRTITATYSGDGRFNPSTDTEDHKVEQPNGAPVAAFSPPTCTAGQPCQFNDGSSDADGRLVAWTWDFGDLTTEDDQNPQHTYALQGTYNVKLTVRDDDGATNEVTQAVVVNAPLPPPNVPPVATDDGYSVAAGSGLLIGAPGVLANDADLDGGSLSVSPASGPTAAGGAFAINADGSFNYTAPATSGVTDSFSYTLNDGQGGQDTGTVFITVQ